MKSYTINIEATIEGKSERDAKNFLIAYVLDCKDRNVSSAGISKVDVDKMFAKELGKLGGQATLKKYGKETMKEWGKKGGRPKA